MAISERFSGCIAIEESCAEIYRSLAGLFPESAHLWSQLAREEDGHAEVLSIAAGLGRGAERAVPESLPSIRSTLRLATRLQEKVESADTLGMDEALSIALKLEESTAEAYFSEFMRRPAETAEIEMLQRFYLDEKSHAERIRDFMRDKGLLEK